MVATPALRSHVAAVLCTCQAGGRACCRHVRRQRRVVNGRSRHPLTAPQACVGAGQGLPVEVRRGSCSCFRFRARTCATGVTAAAVCKVGSSQSRVRRCLGSTSYVLPTGSTLFCILWQEGLPLAAPLHNHSSDSQRQSCSCFRCSPALNQAAAAI